MIRLEITMQARSSKRKELEQTIYELMPLLPQEQGYVGSHFTVVHDDENRLQLIEEWENSNAMQRYFESEPFSVLRGAMKLLTQSSDIQVFTGNNRYHPLCDTPKNVMEGVHKA